MQQTTSHSGNIKFRRTHQDTVFKHIQSGHRVYVDDNSAPHGDNISGKKRISLRIESGDPNLATILRKCEEEGLPAVDKDGNKLPRNNQWQGAEDGSYIKIDFAPEDRWQPYQIRKAIREILQTDYRDVSKSEQCFSL